MNRFILKSFAVGIFLSGSLMVVRPADVALYNVSRVLYNIQTNEEAPQTAAAFPYWIQGQLRLTPTNTVFTIFSSFGTVIDGNFTAVGPLLQRTHLIFQGGREYMTQTQTDYISLTTNFGFQIAFKNNTHTNVALSVPPNNGPATAPHIINLTAAQMIDPAADFTLQWDPFTGGTTNDLVEVQIENVSSNLFDSGALPGSGALDGTATSVTIPANTLVAGRSYVGHLLFENIYYVTNGFAPGYSGYGQDTDFYLSTMGAVPPQLIATVPADGSTNVPGDLKVIFTFNKQMNRNNYSYNGYRFTNSTTAVSSMDGTNFSLMPITPWPTSDISFHLNPVGITPAFCDTNGSPVMPDTFATSFTAGTNLLSNPPVPPYLEILGPPVNGTVQLRLTGEPYRSYELMASSDLMGWNAVNTLVATNGQVVFTDAVPAVVTNRMYRAQVAGQ